jgi:hypothetical protein
MSQVYFPVPFDTARAYAPVTPKQFRKDFPEFADTSIYLNGTLNYWLAVAQRLNNPCVWQDLLPLGIELLAAHFITEEAQSLKAGLAGGNPGQVGGPVQSKSVSEVSISYAVQSAIEEGAGALNGTVYGRRWYHFAMLFGAGAIQL